MERQQIWYWRVREECWLTKLIGVWGLVPESQMLIGNYKPSQYGFFDNAYWRDRALRILGIYESIE